MLGALDGGLVGRKDTERAKGVYGLGAEMIDGFVHNPEALRGRVELKEVAVDPLKVLHSCVHGEHVHAVEQRPGLFDHGAVDRLYPDVDDALAVVWQDQWRSRGLLTWRALARTAAGASQYQKAPVAMDR